MARSRPRRESFGILARSRQGEHRVHRQLYLIEVPPYLLAASSQQRGSLSELARRALHVPSRRVLGSQSQGTEARPADRDRRVRLLQGLRLTRRVLDPVVVTHESRPLLAPEGPDDLERLVETIITLCERSEGQSVRPELPLRPCCPEGELQPPAADVVNQRGALCQGGRVAVEDAVHQDPDTHAGSESRHRRQGRQGLETGTVVGPGERQQVVESPSRVEAELFDRSQRRHVILPAGALSLKLHTEMQRATSNLHEHSSPSFPDLVAAVRGGASRQGGC